MMNNSSVPHKQLAVGVGSVTPVTSPLGFKASPAPTLRTLVDPLGQGGAGTGLRVDPLGNVQYDGAGSSSSSDSDADDNSGGGRGAKGGGGGRKQQRSVVGPTAVGLSVGGSISATASAAAQALALPRGTVASVNDRTRHLVVDAEGAVLPSCLNPTRPLTVQYNTTRLSLTAVPFKRPINIPTDRAEAGRFAPPSLSLATCVGFESEDSVVLFGGAVGTSTRPLADTWVYSVVEKQWSKVDVMDVVPDALARSRKARGFSGEAVPPARSGHCAAGIREVQLGLTASGSDVDGGVGGRAAASIGSTSSGVGSANNNNTNNNNTTNNGTGASAYTTAMGAAAASTAARISQRELFLPTRSDTLGQSVLFGPQPAQEVLLAGRAAKAAAAASKVSSSYFSNSKHNVSFGGSPTPTSSKASSSAGLGGGVSNNRDTLLAITSRSQQQTQQQQKRSNTVDPRDPDPWSYRPSMLVFGGANLAMGAYYNDLWLFDVQLRAWREVNAGGQPPSPRWKCSAAACEQRLFIFGGETSSYAVVNDLHMYDHLSGMWRQLRVVVPCPRPRMSHSVCVVGGDKMIVVGGVDKGAYTDRAAALTTRSAASRGHSAMSPFSSAGVNGSGGDPSAGYSASSPAAVHLGGGGGQRSPRLIHIAPLSQSGGGDEGSDGGDGDSRSSGAHRASTSTVAGASGVGGSSRPAATGTASATPSSPAGAVSSSGGSGGGGGGATSSPSSASPPPPFPQQQQQSFPALLYAPLSDVWCLDMRTLLWRELGILDKRNSAFAIHENERTRTAASATLAGTDGGTHSSVGGADASDSASLMASRTVSVGGTNTNTNNNNNNSNVSTTNISTNADNGSSFINSQGSGGGTRGASSPTALGIGRGARNNGSTASPSNPSTSFSSLVKGADQQPLAAGGAANTNTNANANANANGAPNGQRYGGRGSVKGVGLFGASFAGTPHGTTTTTTANNGLSVAGAPTVVGYGSLEGHVALAFNNRVVVYGGLLNGKWNTRIHTFDVVNETWEFHGDITMTGGFNDGLTAGSLPPPTATITTSSSSSLPERPQPRAYHCGGAFVYQSSPNSLLQFDTIGRLRDGQLHLSELRETEPLIDYFAVTRAQQIAETGIMSIYKNRPVMLRTICLFMYGGQSFPRNPSDFWMFVLSEREKGSGGGGGASSSAATIGGLAVAGGLFGKGGGDRDRVGADAMAKSTASTTYNAGGGAGGSEGISHMLATGSAKALVVPILGSRGPEAGGSNEDCGDKKNVSFGASAVGVGGPSTAASTRTNANNNNNNNTAAATASKQLLADVLYAAAKGGVLQTDAATVLPHLLAGSGGAQRQGAGAGAGGGGGGASLGVGGGTAPSASPCASTSPINHLKEMRRFAATAEEGTYARSQRLIPPEGYFPAISEQAEQYVNGIMAPYHHQLSPASSSSSSAAAVASGGGRGASARSFAAGAGRNVVIASPAPSPQSSGGGVRVGGSSAGGTRGDALNSEENCDSDDDDDDDDDEDEDETMMDAERRRRVEDRKQRLVDQLRAEIINAAHQYILGGQRTTVKKQHRNGPQNAGGATR